MLNTYHDYYYRQFLTKGWTITHFFCILTAYIVIALPFYFSFAGQNFWIDAHQEVMNPTYNYTGYYALQVNSVNGNFSVIHQYINIEGNNASYPSGFSAVLTVTDKEILGSASLLISGYSNYQLTSINVIMYYNIYLPYLAKSVVNGLMWQIQGNCLSANMGAVVQFNSQSSISAITKNLIVNLPPYYPNLIGGLTFTALANQLITTSTFLEYRSQTQVQKDTNSSSFRTFSFTFVKNLNVVVAYYPTILQTLKFKYSTYLVFAIVTYFVFQTLLRLYLRDGLLECVTLVEHTH